jgi:transcriptional/translational regulatory protein YebC/TACO1
MLCTSMMALSCMTEQVVQFTVEIRYYLGNNRQNCTSLDNDDCVEFMHDNVGAITVLRVG